MSFDFDDYELLNQSAEPTALKKEPVEFRLGDFAETLPIEVDENQPEYADTKESIFPELTSEKYFYSDFTNVPEGEESYSAPVGEPISTLGEREVTLSRDKKRVDKALVLWEDVIKPTPARAAAAMVKGAAGGVEFIGDVTGSGDLVRTAQDWTSFAEEAEGQIREEHRLEDSSWSAAGAGALSSMYLQAPFMAAGLLARSVKTASNIALAGLGAVTGGDTYARRRAQGSSPPVAAASAAFDGIVEVVTEKLPMDSLISIMKAGKGGFVGLAKKMAVLYGEELIGESIATFLQDANEKVMGDPNATEEQRVEKLKEYINSGEAKTNWINTLKTTAIQTTLMGGGAGAVNYGAKQVSYVEQKYQDGITGLRKIIEVALEKDTSKTFDEVDIEELVGFKADDFESATTADTTTGEDTEPVDTLSGIVEDISKAPPEEVKWLLEEGLPVAQLPAPEEITTEYPFVHVEGEEALPETTDVTDDSPFVELVDIEEEVDVEPIVTVEDVAVEPVEEPPVTIEAEQLFYEYEAPSEVIGDKRGKGKTGKKVQVEEVSADQRDIESDGDGGTESAQPTGGKIYDEKDAAWHGLDTAKRNQLLRDAKNVGLIYRVGEKGLTRDVLIRNILEKINAGGEPEYKSVDADEAEPIVAEVEEDEDRTSISPEELINGITREAAGDMMAEGDEKVLQHIRDGVEDHGVMLMEDAIRNQEVAEVANVPKEERAKIRENLARLRPQIDEIFAKARAEDTENRQEDKEEPKEQGVGEKKTAAEELAEMSDDDIFDLINEVAEEVGVAPVEKPTAAKATPTFKKPVGEAIEGLDDLMKGVATAFGVDTSKLISFPPHLDREAYAKARPFFMEAWAKFKDSGRSLKDYIRYLFDNFSKLIPNFQEYVAYLTAELRGTEDFTKEEAPVTEPVAEEETTPKPQEGMYVTDAPEITHTTRKGKEITGVIALDLTKDEAQEFDKYTWKKDGGYFIRIKHVERPEAKVEAPEVKEKITSEDIVAYVVEKIQTKIDNMIGPANEDARQTISEVESTDFSINEILKDHPAIQNRREDVETYKDYVAARSGVDLGNIREQIIGTSEIPAWEAPAEPPSVKEKFPSEKAEELRVWLREAIDEVNFNSFRYEMFSKRIQSAENGEGYDHVEWANDLYSEMTGETKPADLENPEVLAVEEPETPEAPPKADGPPNKPPRKRRTAEEIAVDKEEKAAKKAERESARKERKEAADLKKKEAAAKKRKLAKMGNFENVGYVYDPEKLRKGVEGKTPASAVKKILNSMLPSKIWKNLVPEDATNGSHRYYKTFIDTIEPFKELAATSRWRTSAKEIERDYPDINVLLDKADKYMADLKPIIDALTGKKDVAGIAAALQDTLFPGAKKEDGTYPERYYDLEDENKSDFFNGTLPTYFDTSSQGMYNIVMRAWENYLPDENLTLLSEINPHKRKVNEAVIRTGLPNYGAKKIKKTEDFKDPFNFSGVGFGEKSWIDQEERGRVVPAAFNSFKDLAKTIGANDVGMSINGELAIQFANLGHLAKGAAAAYFPDKKTINFTRDNGDGTLAHEWSHAFHRLSDSEIQSQIDQVIWGMEYIYDFEAGARYADDLMAKDSRSLKRIINSKKQSRIDFVKDQIRENFENKVRTETHYYKTAKEIDTDYTARNSEMWARGFEASVYDNLGGKNNYLVGDFVGEGRVGGKAYQDQHLVYPAGMERESINEDIKHLFEGLNWSEDGTPSLKEDYVELKTIKEKELNEALDKLLDEVEVRYNAIWSSEPSPDGNFWYQYDATSFAPMMQPDSYVGYDKEHKGEGQDGQGAVAYSHQLTPDEILDFGLTNIQHEGEGVIYTVTGDGGIGDGFREDGDEALDEISAKEDKGPARSRDTEERDTEGGEPGTDGSGETRRPGKETLGGEGDSVGELHTAPSRGNYLIENEELTDPKGVDARFMANLAAIKVLKKVEEEGRSATASEKDIMATYSGWGGIAEAFSYSPQGVWKRRAALLSDALTNEESSAAASSSPTSYYTPVPVARFIWQLAQRFGFNGGTVLDPSTGANGIFLGTMPTELNSSTSIHGVEKDSISSRIASQLYELSNIEEKPFQDSRKPQNRFDLAVTNVPFESTVVTDSKHNRGQHKLHNYFINKMIDVVAPGGLIMAISSSATLDTDGKHLAEYAKKADFVGAVRLPSGIYSSTNVVTDIIVFRKKIEGSKFTGIAPEVFLKQGTDKDTGLTFNQYFIDHPEMVAGNLEKVAGQWGDDSLRVTNNEDLTERLSRIGSLFPGDIVEKTAVKELKSLDDIVPAPGTVKEGGLYVTDKNKAAWKIDGDEILLPTSSVAEKKNAKIATGYVGLINQVRTVLRSQRSGQDEATIKADQKELTRKYKAFVKAHGPVNKEKNVKVYIEDPDSSWVVALEDFDPDTGKVKKLADLFTKRVTGLEERPTTAESDHDALAMSLDEYGYPNLEYMAGLRGSDTDTVLKGVEDKIIENPETGFLETMEEYLSGQVKRKLVVAKEMAEEHPEYKRNVELLEASLPDDIPPHRITARIGAPWIDPQHLSDFVADKLDMPYNVKASFSFSPVNGAWSMSFGQTGWNENKAQLKRDIAKLGRSVEASKVWGTKKINFLDLIKHALEGRRPVITYYGEDKKKHMDVEATKGAEAKLKDIQEEFGRWLFAEGERVDTATQRFNDIINVSTTPNYNGAHLTFPGKSLMILTEAEREKIGVSDAVTFYPHQPSAVWKYIRSGNLYLGHEVGAGKTVSMALIAMEAKRLRGKKKVVYVTMNDSTMGQAIAEIKGLYPLANILQVQVSTNAERQRNQLQKMAMNEFDIAIMRQQDLDRIQLSPDAERVSIDAEVLELQEVLQEAKAAGARIHEREIQVRLNSLEEKLKDTVHEEAKSKNVYFDDLGIDLIIVDEAHAYKNIPYATRLSGITGMNPIGSKTAQAFFRKAQYLNAQYPKNDSIVLASGTPLTNSIAELYNIQRLLQPAELKRQGMWQFDRWIATYGDIGSQLEWDAARGTHKSITTNRRIVNAGRLLATAYLNIDSVRAEDTPIIRPEMRGGGPIPVAIEPNKYVQDYSEIVLARAKALDIDSKAEFEGVPDNMLRIISNSSKVAIDQRLDERYADTKLQKDSKIYVASRNIYKQWKAEKKNKGVQLVFSDLGTPKKKTGKFKVKSDAAIAKLTEEQLEEYRTAEFESANQSTTKFNVYDGLTDELVKLGIPRNQIAYIHDADHTNKSKKAANLRTMFRKVNAGEIRVLIGSTTKAGTGVNVQSRISDIHHLDIWWNFSAWEQRNGRGIRSGNIYTDLGGVGIWNYATEGTVDALRWDKVAAKGKVLNAVLGGDVNLDIIEDLSDATMSAKQMAAIASGDPLMAEQADLLQTVQGLKYEQSSFLDTVRGAKQELAKIPSEIEAATNRIAKYEKSSGAMEDVTAVRIGGEDFVIAKDGKKIAAALEKAIGKDMRSWDAAQVAPLFVLGTHKDIKSKDGKKSIEFSPLTIKADIIGQSGDPYFRNISLGGAGIGIVTRNLAEIDPKKKTVKVYGGVSRFVTDYITSRKAAAEEDRGKIEDYKSDKPKLERVIATPWPKTEELATAETSLREVETKMAEAGVEKAGSPETGMAIEDYRGSIVSMDDIAERDNWLTYNDVISPSRELTLGIVKPATDLAKYFNNIRKKFNPELWGRYQSETATLLASEGTTEYSPKAFTTIDGETKFWITADKYVDAETWQLAERAVGKDGTWTYAEVIDYYDAKTPFLVHRSEKGGPVDAFVKIYSETAPKTAVKFIAGKLVEGVKKKKEAKPVLGVKITAENGQAYMFEDLGESVFKAGQTLREFTRELRKKLGKAFAKVKDLVAGLYKKLNANLERITLGKEVGGFSVGKEQQKKNYEPKTEAAQDREVAEAEAAYENLKDVWFGEKDVKRLQGEAEKRDLQGRIKEALGEKEYTETVKDHDRAIQIYLDLKRNPGHRDIFYKHLTKDQQRIVDLSQNLPTSIIKVAESIRSRYDALGLEALADDVITNVLDNYTGRIWDIKKTGGASRGEFGRKFGTTTRHAKRRKLDTILEGWSPVDSEGNDKTPLELKVQGATNSLQIVKEEINKTLADKRFVKALGKITDSEGNSMVTTSPPRDLEYKEIEHPNFSVWAFVGSVKGGKTEASVVTDEGKEIKLGRNFLAATKYAVINEADPRDTKVFGARELATIYRNKNGDGFVIQERTVLLEKKKLFAPVKQAENLNNILGISKLANVPGFHTITKYNAIIKSWILQSSFFHHLAFMRSYYLGTNKKQWDEMSIRKAYKSGVEAIEKLTPEVILGVENGLTLGLRQDWSEELLQEKTLIGEILDKLKVTKAVKDKVLKLREMQADFLFGEFGAGLKAKSFLIEYRNQIKEYPEQTEKEIATRVAALINDDFGGLHLGRLGRNPTLQHVFRLAALAPDWTESNIRSMVKAIKSGTKAETKLYRTFWAGIMLKSAIASVFLSFLLSGGDIEELKKRYKKAWDSGNLKWTKVDITPIYKVLGGTSNRRKYFSIFGHFTDPMKFMRDPIRSAHHKGSVVYSLFHEMFAGVDWKGHRFTDLRELTETGKTVTWGPGGTISFKKLPSFAISQLIGMQPVQIQNLVSWWLGEMESFDAIGNSLGLGITSTYGGGDNVEGRVVKKQPVKKVRKRPVVVKRKKPRVIVKNN